MKKHFVTTVLLPVCALGALAGCVRQEDYDALNSRVMRQEQQMQQLNMQLSGVQPAQADTWSQVQSMRQELATMRGQLDDLQGKAGLGSEVPRLRDQINRQEQAIRQMASQLALDLPMLDAPQAAGPTGALGNGGAPAAMAAAPAATRTPGPGAAPGTHVAADGTILVVNPGQMTSFQTAPETKPTGPITVPPSQSGTMSVSGAGVPAAAKPAAVAAAPSGDTATVLYDTGMNSFNERRYKDALKSFHDFTETYKDHKLVSNAWFWQGEAEYQLGNYPGAALAYEQVISKFPKSNKTPSAYLKQGISFYKAGKKDAGKIRLEELIKKHPDSPEAQRAKQYIKDNK